MGPQLLLISFLLRNSALQSLVVSQQVIMRAQPFQKLADFTADRLDHLEQRFVGLANLTTKELHHSENLIAELNGESKGAVKIILGGHSSAREMVVFEHI